MKRKIKFVTLSTLYIFIFLLIMFISSYIIYKIDPNIKTYFDSLWYSIVTVSTVGYGDIIPATKEAKIIVLIMIVLGVVAVSVFTANVTSKMIEAKILLNEGWKNMDNLKNHLIICGYKPSVKLLIKDLIEKSEFKKDNIVLIHNILTPEIKLLLDELECLKFIEGDFTEEEILLKAKVDLAKKAIVISDLSEDSDSKVLGAVILLKNLNPYIYTVAEITNNKFELYLEKIKCDEIIFSEDYQKFLLSKAIRTPGISKVIGEILKGKNFEIIKSDSFQNKTFKESFDYFFNKNIILLGVIENYGTIDTLKKLKIEKIRSAINISNLPFEIQKLKKIKLNNVVFLPDDDYIIPEYSAFIILKKELNV
jgi:voltage-gated potassium channel